MILGCFPRVLLDFLSFKNHQKIIKKSSKNHPFAGKNKETLPKLWFFIVVGKFSWFVLANWWYFDDFLMISQGFAWFPPFKNHQKIILLLEKNCQNLGFSLFLGFLDFFQQNDDVFLMIFGWFPKVLLDFLSFKNHQKIILLLEKKRKFAKTLDFYCSWQFFLIFFSKIVIFWCFFWWFPTILLDFLSFKNYEKIIKKTSFCKKKSRKLAKTSDFHCFWQVFLICSSQMVIFWWFPRVLFDFLSFKNHQKNHPFIRKNKENLPKLWFFIVFGKFSWFVLAKWWFFWWFLDDFNTYLG